MRIGGARVGVVDEIDRCPSDGDGPPTAVLDMKLETQRRAAAEGLDAASSARARRSASSTSRSRSAASDEGFQDGATIPLAQATPEPVEIDEVFNIFDEPTRAARSSNLREFGNAFAGRGARPQRGDRRAAAAAARPRAGARNLADPRHAARRASSAALGRRRGRGRAGRRDAGRAVREPRHHVHRAGRASRGRSSRRRSRARRRRSTRRSRASRSSARSCATTRPVPRAAAGRRARCAPPRRRWPTRSRSAPPTLRRSPALNEQLSRRFEALEDFAEDPLVPLGIQRPDDTVGDPASDARIPHARPDRLQLRDAVVPQRRRACSPRATRTAPGSASSSSPRRTGPNNEGGPSTAPANGADPHDELPPLEPVPEHGRAGPDARSARPATRSSRSASQVIGNVPGNQGTETDGQVGAGSG